MITAEQVDYIELAKALVSDVVLTNPLYNNFSLDDVILEICKVVWRMNKAEGQKVVLIFREATGRRSLKKIEKIWLAYQEVRFSKIWASLVKAAKENGRWASPKDIK